MESSEDLISTMTFVEVCLVSRGSELLEAGVQLLLCLFTRTSQEIDEMVQLSRMCRHHAIMGWASARTKQGMTDLNTQARLQQQELSWS